MEFLIKKKLPGVRIYFTIVSQAIQFLEHLLWKLIRSTPSKYWAVLGSIPHIGEAALNRNEFTDFLGKGPETHRKYDK